MNPRYGSAAGVVHIFKSFVPSQCFGCRASYTGYTGYAESRTFTGEVFFKDRAIVILLFVHWGMDGEALGCVCHLFITNGYSCDFLQSVNPGIAYTLRELFLLAPSYTFRKHVCKCFAYNLLFDGCARAHFGRRVQAHGYIEEFLVKEGNSAFYAPRTKTLIGTQTVVEMKFGEFADRFFMEGLRCWCFVEVEVTAKHFIGTFARKYHFDTH